MAEKPNDLLQRPLYVFDLPHELLMTIHLKDDTALQPLSCEIDSERGLESHSAKSPQENLTVASRACALCGISFLDLSEKRSHAKSDWHRYNLKEKLKGHKPIQETEFEKLVGDLTESISGSETSGSDDGDDGNRKDNTLTALFQMQAKLDEGGPEGEHEPLKRKRGSGCPPLLWFSTPFAPPNTFFGIYRALFTEVEQHPSNIVGAIRQKQLKPAQKKQTQNDNNGVPLHPSMTDPHFFLCMIGGGHFAAMIISLTPKVSRKANGVEERQALVIAHKTFHRYTTRKKQGGSQSANDSSKGPAHSAGAGIRRYNEAALEAEVRALLSEWRDMINTSMLKFVRATGTTNRKTLFGPYDDQVLRLNDPRYRSFPFSTRRATQAELMRAFVELTRMKVSRIDEAAVQASTADEVKEEGKSPKTATAKFKQLNPEVSKEEEVAIHHTSQLQALIRRSKAPAVLSYLSNNSIPPDFAFHPLSTQANHHASTPLHLAASINSASVVTALLMKAGANPTRLNGEGRPPFDIAGDRATRDAFRVARFESGESRWNWEAAHCPPPLSKAEADKRDESAKLEAEKVESHRRKAELERLKLDASTDMSKRATGKALGVVERTGSEIREQEARGLTPDMRTKLERERRARAAEERIRRMTGGGGAGAGR
ncbi:MAG: hypothetical protein Q9187_000017 [Circinaria calcarea]